MLNALASVALQCVIVYSPGTNGDWTEKYWHEMAHCNGWVHPEKGGVTGRAYQPPKRYLHVYTGPLSARLMTTRQAQRACGGSYGCQWFSDE